MGDCWSTRHPAKRRTSNAHTQIRATKLKFENPRLPSVVRQQVAFLAALWLVPILAGCIGGDDDVGGSDGAALAVVTETTGSVTGQILTLDLEPAPEVQVGLLNRTGGLQVTETDARGNFTFNGMPAGQYRLQISDDCCRPYTEQLTVAAGKVTTVNLQVEPLSDADLRTPFVSEYEWEGFISCGIGVLSTDYEICERTDANSDNQQFFNVSAGLEDLHFGLDWRRAGTSLNNELKMQLQHARQPVCARNLAAAWGPPPLYMSMRDSNNQCTETHFTNINGTMQFELNVATGVNNFVYQQSFIVYRAEFYYQLAPEGFDPIPERI